MKKLSGLLAVSLIAIMMAPAARADIASTAYVDTKDDAISDAMEVKANKKTSTEQLSEKDDTSYPTVAAAYNIANVALGDNAVEKEQGTAGANKALITNASGTVTTGTIATGMITNSAVTNGKIANGAVTADKIGANAVTTAKIADSAVTDAKLATDSVTPLKVKDGLITAGTNVTVSRNASTGVVTISSADTKYTLPAATDKVLGGVMVDTAMSDTSTNPVQNKVANAAIADAKKAGTDAATAAANAKSAADAAQATANGLKTSKQDTLVATGDGANIAGDDGVSVSIDSTSGKITVKGNQAAISTALAGKQASLSTAQMNAVNSGITSTKVSSYDAAVTTANAALPKATYDSQVGTVSAANMGTTATTVVGAIKEIKDAVSTADGAAVKADQGTTNKDKAVITDANGKVTTGQIATGMVADKAVTTAKIADGAVGTTQLGANAVTSAKIADGTIVNADISTSAAIAQSKISGLTDALAAKFVAPAESATSTDGTYTLTMKVVNSVPTYTWEKIGR